MSKNVARHGHWFIPRTRGKITCERTVLGRPALLSSGSIVFYLFLPSVVIYLHRTAALSRTALHCPLSRKTCHLVAGAMSDEHATSVLGESE